MKDNKIVITLVAPIYGVEKYITQFADSVLSQSYPYIEYIFVNDGTQDRSMELLEALITEKYEYRRNDIKVVHKKNAGLPAARRTGLSHATGDYVFNVDSDDWLEPDAVYKIASKIIETNADIVYFNWIKEYPQITKYKTERIYGVEQRDSYIFDMYNHRASAAVWNKCVRRSLYIDNTIFTPVYGYAEDCYLNTQLVGYAQSIAYLNEYLYHYRKGNPNAMTAQNIRNRKREYALNFMDLYTNYYDIPHNKNNPITPIFDSIVVQAGWYSLLYGLDLFKRFSFLASAICKAKISRNTNVSVIAQFLTKCYTFLLQ